MQTLLPGKKSVLFFVFLKKPACFFYFGNYINSKHLFRNRKHFFMHSNSSFDNRQIGYDAFSDLFFSVSVSMHSTAQHSTAQHSTAQQE